MSSDDDMFGDPSQSPPKNSPMTSLSSITPTPTSSVKVGPGTPSPVSGTSSGEMLSSLSPVKSQNRNTTRTSPSPPSPTPPSPGRPAPELQSNFQDHEPQAQKNVELKKVSKIKIEFFDGDGVKIRQTRYSNHAEIIDIVSNVVRSTETNYLSAAASKLCESDLFKHEIHEYVIKNISKQVEAFITSEDCPLRNPNLMSEIEKLSEFDFEQVFMKCMELGGEFLNSICKICFGVDRIDGDGQKYLRQRLLAILAISTFSRSRKVNVFQKILGEFFKLKNTGKQALQLLHRLGLSVVTMSIRADQDVIGTHFLNETKRRKYEIETWFERRKMLESILDKTKLSVEFIDEKYVPAIVDLGEEYPKTKEKHDLYQPDEYVLELIKQHGGDAEIAVERHLDSRPKLYDVSYDNIDITVNSHEFIMGQKDNSIHWCSSIVVEDVVEAREISDVNVDRNILKSDFEERIDLTTDEIEHVFDSYVELVANFIAANWPNVLPDLKVSRIKHQYSQEFEKEVKIFTGPLVCETESTLEGISKVITTLTDDLCPTIQNEEGKNVPIFPTTFSGDQKTEKSARSAQLALLDNGSMRDKLGFIEGRHELLHFMFMLTDIGLDMFADKDNIEEAVSLSRLIKLLNPKLENKKGKDHYYAFRDLYSDIYLGQLGEFLRNFLNISSLETDGTPDVIKMEKVMGKKQLLLKNLVCSW